MIRKQYGKFILACDICGDMADKDFDSFEEALGFSATNGWRAEKEGGEWVNYCPDCVEG